MTLPDGMPRGNAALAAIDEASQDLRYFASLRLETAIDGLSNAKERSESERYMRRREPPMQLQKKVSTDSIYRRIADAILEHRLTPGRHIVEDRLAAIFGVSRAKVRQALVRLAQEKIVTFVPNRGAFVTMPSIGQAREVLDTRRILEVAIVRQVAQTITRSQIDELAAIASQEEAARRDQDRQALIKLSGEFHRQLAILARNRTMSAIMHELTSLTCLVIMLYGNSTVSACATEEHRRLLEALGEHDGETAAARLLEHLDHVEAELTLVPPQSDEAAFEEIFSE